MLNVHKSVSYSDGFNIEVKTLEYCYPVSIVRVIYSHSPGNKPKTFHIRVGYVDGHLRFQSKHTLSDRAKFHLLVEHNLKYIHKLPYKQRP